MEIELNLAHPIRGTVGPGSAPGSLGAAPNRVMDTGAGIAPYNHAEAPLPLRALRLWGTQVGELNINPRADPRLRQGTIT